MTVRARTAIVFIALLTGCSSTGPTSPVGWQPAPSATGIWTTGSGAAARRYTYEKRAYDGTLQALASQQAIDVVLRNHGAKFVKSDVFAPCPGLAAIATFTLGKTRTLEDGFSVINGQAALVTYEHANDAPADKGVTDAMTAALCGGMAGS